MDLQCYDSLMGRSIAKVVFLPVGVVEFLHQSASVCQSDLDTGNGLRAVHTDGSTSLSFTGSLVLRASLE